MQFIGDMLAFHTVRSGVAMAVDGGAGARVVCGNGKSQKKGGGFKGAECGGKARTCAK